ncbi:hypothetical protein BDP27DRAFT_1371034 [Rhodocollybia butyracea]|uniref:Uncharacterized protein n=1 Tax=Rhodocollybia butyracea TaxID=206335 RepID=A0A9P5P7V0_9AGAR|nr:hypothetical protein BDP27DRAFT_1371034 [Rhodocollybia butyracea]
MPGFTHRKMGGLYAGITRGKPTWNGFEGKIGIPLVPDNRPLEIKFQAEWRKLKDEFNVRFKLDGLLLHEKWHLLPKPPELPRLELPSDPKYPSATTPRSKSKGRKGRKGRSKNTEIFEENAL